MVTDRLAPVGYAITSECIHGMVVFVCFVGGGGGEVVIAVGRVYPLCLSLVTLMQLSHFYTQYNMNTVPDTSTDMRERGTSWRIQIQLQY